MRTAFLPAASITSIRQLPKNPHPIQRSRSSHPCNARASLTAKMSISEHVAQLRALQPELSPQSHKGQSGRIAIIGGSDLYTGAPYFASQSALLAGADLSYVYTAPSAAPVIKSYSPDLIVHPGFKYLGPDLEALERMHAVIIGPGLGRGEDVGGLIEKVLTWSGVIVLDADALWFLQKETIREFLRRGGISVLTPNKIELTRLLASSSHTTESFTKEYQNVIILEKGEVDRIVFDGHVTEVSTPAARKRVGGQGDVLAGVLGAFCGWCEEKADVASAAVCASMVARTAGRMAFADVGRALVASDLLRFVGKAADAIVCKDGG